MVIGFWEASAISELLISPPKSDMLSSGMARSAKKFLFLL
jgi:hypothetical protein